MALSKSTPYIRFWLLLSVVYAILGVGCDFIDSPVSGWVGILTMIKQGGVVAALASALWLALSVNRYVFLVGSPVVLLLTTVALYYKFALSVYITSLTIELAMVNNFTVWATAIDWHLMVAMLAAIAVGTTLAVYRYRCVTTPKYWPLWLAVGFGVVSLPFVAVPRLQSPVSARVPFNTIYNFITYLQHKEKSSHIRPAFDRIPATCQTDSLTVVVILGESLRADHLPMNGYHRNTTPLLSATPNVISLPNLSGPYAYTHQSVPYILTRADSLNFKLAETEPGFNALYRKAGYRTAWISNQDDNQYYSYFIQHSDTIIHNGNTKSLWGYDSWLDSELLPHIDNVLVQRAPRQLLVLHTIGSHWWYPSHYERSDVRFQPDADSRVFNELTDNQVINSYDNTIIASDRFWHEVISRLRNRRAVVLYISDHGESLGEEGRHMHNNGSPECLRPAGFVWMSNRYIADFPAKAAALRSNAALPHDLDVIFHTALSLGDVNTPVLDRSKSLSD